MSRIFVAIPIQNQLAGKIQAWQEQHPELKVRWIQPHNLHITLVPPWQENNVAAVCRKLQTIHFFGPIPMRFDSVSLGPNPRSPRLLWARGITPPALPNLVSRLHETLGHPTQARDFKLHATLARLRKKDVSNQTAFREPVSWQQVANSFVLMESRLLSHGAEYTIQEFKL